MFYSVFDAVNISIQMNIWELYEKLGIIKIVELKIVELIIINSSSWKNFY